jgi:hypothetical protein
MVGVPRIRTLLGTATLATTSPTIGPLLTLPPGQAPAGFVGPASWYTETTPSVIAAAVAASPQHVARWQGKYDTFWAVQLPGGQVRVTSSRCLQPKQKGLGVCSMALLVAAQQRDAPTFLWQPVVFQ